MANLIAFGTTSNIVRFSLKNLTTGAPLTALTSASAGLIIGTIADNEATTTTYTQAASNIETITTLGTFATPTASKCRFKEVDATNHPGLYEFQIANARFAVSSSQRLVISVSGFATLLPTDYEIQLVQFNPYDTVRLGLTSLPNVASGSAGAIITSGTGTAQLSVTAGVASANTTQLAGQTVTAAAGVTFPTSVASPTNITAGTITTATNLTTNNDKTGYSLSGTQTFNNTGTWTGNITGNLSGSVGSVTGAVGSVTGNVGGNVTGTVGSVVGAVGSVTGNVGGNVTGTVGSVVTKTGYALTSAYDYATGTVAMTESYAANGVAPTPVQATYAIHQMLMDFAITSTSLTVKKLDNTATAFVVTLDSATVPTSAVRV